MMLIFGCTFLPSTSVSMIKTNPSKYLGQDVTVKGMVVNSIKIGQLSAFSLTDGNETIGVSSQLIPPEGANVTVTGTVVKDTLFGYYILANNVQIS